jgi:hypothetical protein
MSDEPTNLSTSTPAPADPGVLGTAPVETAPDPGVLGVASTPAPEAAKEPPKEAAPPAAEPKYEYKDVPEGYDPEELTAFAKEHKLSPDAAQKVLERDIAHKQAFIEQVQADFKQKSTEGWIKELKADPVLGGKNWEATLMQARRAADLLSPETRAKISEEGMQSYPTLVRAMYEIGAKLKEDTFVRGDAATKKEHRGLSSMYN